jgi:alanine-glyoxylate transaminase/serine-glyoxylate transaminase/serine-pyruvate transaminase
MGSCGAEALECAEWRVDAAIANSQKSLGAPPGLVVLSLSKRAVDYIEDRSASVGSSGHFLDLRHWLPVMRAYETGRKSWFATPNVNLIRAMHVSLSELLSQGRPALLQHHIAAANEFRDAIHSLGLSFVPEPECSGVSMTAVSLLPPAGSSKDRRPIVPVSALLDALIEEGVLVGHGTHAVISDSYFRVGHTGVTVTTEEGRQRLRFTAAAIGKALRRLQQASIPSRL